MNALNMKQRKKMKIRTEEEEQEIMERKPKTICTCGHKESSHSLDENICWTDEVILSTNCPCKKFSPQKKQEEE